MLILVPRATLNALFSTHLIEYTHKTSLQNIEVNPTETFIFPPNQTKLKVIIFTKVKGKTDITSKNGLS